MPAPSDDITLDYYHVLGVGVEAGIEEIQSAFRQKAKKYHPDLNPNRQEWAKTKFQEINAAYRVLSNDAARLAYDNERRVRFGIKYQATPAKPKQRASWTPPTPYKSAEDLVAEAIGEKRRQADMVLMVLGVIVVVNIVVLFVAFYVTLL